MGIDEVGRGPWAGPLVVGAVVLGDTAIEGLNDSKKLSAKRRLVLDQEIRENAAGYGLGWVSASEIDEIGLAAALRLATIRAVEHVTVPYHEIMIDGTVNFLAGTSKAPYVTTLAKGDSLIASISAASIIAKVARDTYMAEQAAVYPEYGFDKNVGYGTSAHIAAIEKHGVTPLHRLSFAPLQKYQQSNMVEPAPEVKETSKSIGDAAELLVVDYLKAQGHTIIARNWRTRFAEIDIISHYRGVIYFTEVKYRQSQRQGGGLAAITSQKLKQMRDAAEWYIHAHYFDRSEARLAIATVTPKGVEGWFSLSE